VADTDPEVVATVAEEVDSAMMMGAAMVIGGEEEEAGIEAEAVTGLEAGDITVAIGVDSALVKGVVTAVEEAVAVIQVVEEAVVMAVTIGVTQAAIGLMAVLIVDTVAARLGDMADSAEVLEGIKNTTPVGIVATIAAEQANEETEDIMPPPRWKSEQWAF